MAQKPIPSPKSIRLAYMILRETCRDQNARSGNSGPARVFVFEGSRQLAWRDGGGRLCPMRRLLVIPRLDVARQKGTLGLFVEFKGEPPPPPLPKTKTN